MLLQDQGVKSINDCLIFCQVLAGEYIFCDVSKLYTQLKSSAHLGFRVVLSWPGIVAFIVIYRI